MSESFAAESRREAACETEPALLSPPPGFSDVESAFPGPGPIALLPVAAPLADDSDLGGSAPFDGVTGGTALLPVAPDVGGDADFDASAPGAALSGSAGFGVIEAGAVALGGMALLPVEPGLAGDVLGLAEMSGLAEAVGLPPLDPGPEAVGFVQFALEDDGVALGGTALLPVGPGLAGAELGPADLSEALPEEPV